MLLVVDAQKGIQTQTAECLLIGDLLQKKLLVVINKIDALALEERETKLKKLRSRLTKTLASMSFGDQVPIYCVSALEGTNIDELRAGLCDAYFVPQRELEAPLLMYVDHCFAIKGQGTICTGTLLQGCVAVNDTVELPQLGEQRKVKSIQMFKKQVGQAAAGDRIGLSVTQFNAKLMERGIIAQPDYLKPVYAVCVKLHPIPYYKQAIRSRSKLHITVGHVTVMANVILFREVPESKPFTIDKLCEYVDELLPAECAESGILALLQFETPVLTTLDTKVIASKLDMDMHSNSCRLAFWGHIAWQTQNVNFEKDLLPQMGIFKLKVKQGNVHRVVNANEIIVQNLFKKEANRDLYVGMQVQLSTGETGYIERTFGQTTKVCIVFRIGLAKETLEKLKSERAREILVFLRYKKIVFNKKAGLLQ